MGVKTFHEYIEIAWKVPLSKVRPSTLLWCFRARCLQNSCLQAIYRISPVGTGPGRAEIPLIGVGRCPGVKKQLAAIMRFIA